MVTMTGRMDKESHQGNSVRERDKVGGDSSSGGAGSLLLLLLSSEPGCLKKKGRV